MGGRGSGGSKGSKISSSSAPISKGEKIYREKVLKKAMEMGLFEVVIRTVERGDKLPLEAKTTKVTGKGQVYFVNKFLAQNGE